MLILAVTGAAAALGLLLYGVLTEAEEKATIRASLRQLGTYEVENVRDTELLTPFRERALAPFLRRITDLGRRLTPVESARRKLILSGRASPDALDRFLAMRVLFLALIPVWFVLVFFVAPISGSAAFAVFGLLAATSFLGPEAILNRRVAERQYKIRVKLPDILDLLTISVEAGLGFEQALDRTVASVPGPLSEEFVRMLGETRAGATRAEAMRALDERTDVPEVRSFVLAILQADTFGVSIGRVLRAQADEMRVKRRQLAQEQAQKAPVKMLIPMVFCIFPALFVVVIGPAVINIYNQFLNK
ncbi:MAG: type II secretion system F family protein [Actinobacteria bacterium]|nr:MAG: type II secretion system F family protein [Actinomycetota bacterium]